jgi:S-adenosylmethionine-diacylgycerolhomoserine-N-methlytransferase
MIPDWRGALSAAGAALTADGRIEIVDFGDFDGLPRAAGAALRLWLAKFHVTPRSELLQALERSDSRSGLRLYAGRYAFRWRGARLPGSVLANVAVPPQAAEIS